VAFVNGVILGTLLFGAVLVWQRDYHLCILLLAALLIVIFTAAFIGSSLPLLLQKLKVDPAIAAGPFIAVTNDVVGLSIYLTLATIYLAHFR
jgi:magnesium transporter